MVDYLFKRVLAYTIDMLLVSIVVSSIISSSVVNFQLDEYNKNYEEYYDLYVAYYEQSNNEIATCSDLEEAIKDEKLTEEDYVLDFEEITDLLKKEEITTEEYDSKCKVIVDEYNNNKMTSDYYEEQVNHYYYKLEKSSIISYLVNIGACLLYFVLFQGFTYGQTLGKKIMRLKVVSLDGERVSYKQLFIRTLFLFSIMYYALMIVSVLVVPENLFINTSNVLYILNMILFMIIGLTIVVDKDRKGLHGNVSKTKVILLDFKGNEIKLNKKENSSKKKVKTKSKTKNDNN